MAQIITGHWTDDAAEHEDIVISALLYRFVPTMPNPLYIFDNSSDHGWVDLLHPDEILQLTAWLALQKWVGPYVPEDDDEEED